MKKNKEIVIIGAGIAGLSAAYFLNKSGFQVRVLDKGNGLDNCSYGNAGMIVPSHIIPLASPGVISKGLKWMLKPESPFYIHPAFDRDLFSWGWKFRKAATHQHVEESAPLLRDLLMENRQILINLEEDESLDFDLQKNGLFMFCKTEEGLEEEAEVAEKANSIGVPAQILSAEEVRRMVPNIKLDIIGATYFPKDSHIYPGSLMDGLKKLLTERGVEFIFNEEVTDLDIQSGGVKGIKTEGGGLIPADRVVLATGAWSKQLTGKIGMNLPLQAGKGYSITLENPNPKPEMCGIFAEVKVTMTPMNGMLRFAGTMEITSPNLKINPKKISGLKKSVISYLPEYRMSDLENQKVWVGLRPCSPDGLPYVGKSKKISGLYFSTGQAMMGMSLGMVSGKILSELITNGNSELAHPLIDPNRYDE